MYMCVCVCALLVELQLLSSVGCSYSDVSPYFVNAFGSYERLDYGTGHELNFIAFLFCLSKVRLSTID